MTRVGYQEKTEPKTVPEMLERCVALFPDRPAYSESKGDVNEWITLSWKEVKEESDKWRRALVASGLKPTDRVAVLLPNSINAVLADQSILGCALTPVPLHAIDTPKSSAYILNDSEAKLLIVPKTLRWNAIRDAAASFPHLTKVVVTNDDVIENAEESSVPVVSLKDWLESGKNAPLPTEKPTEEDLAAILYTSGTTGNPKGVMLSHSNIVTNAQAIAEESKLDETDVFLSFLPFSHTFERSCTYYHAQSIGAHMCFVRNSSTVIEDLKHIKPTCFHSVPKVFAQLHQKFLYDLTKNGYEDLALFNLAQAIGWRKFCQENGLKNKAAQPTWLDDLLWPYLEKKFAGQVRDLFGGRLTYSLVGGAPLNNADGVFFCSMGLPILQGYGLTETSPAVCLNQRGMNNPELCGPPIPHVQIRLGPDDEVQVKGPNVMKGYWKLPEETAAAFTEDGWLKTGDQGQIYENGQLRITGRIKDIIVTSTGEKIPPNDLEQAILTDPLFDQIMCIGENRPYIAALAVVNPEEFAKLAKEVNADPCDPATYERRDIQRLAHQRLKKAANSFPQYGVPRKVWLLKDPWTLNDGLLTVTLKPRRSLVAEKFKEQIEKLYQSPQATPI